MCTANLVFEHVNQNPFHLRPMPDWICRKSSEETIYACKKAWQLSLIHGVSEDMLWKWRGRDGWIPLVSFLDKKTPAIHELTKTFWANILYGTSLPTWILHQNISKSSEVTLAVYNCEYQGFSRSALKLPHVGISQDCQPLRSYWYNSAS